MKEIKKDKVKKFLLNVGMFFIKGLTMGRWEVQFKWKI